MFEYNLFSFKVYGFEKILYLDENRLIFSYKHKKLFVSGKNLRAYNLIDKSIEVKGIIEKIEVQYLGDTND